MRKKNIILIFFVSFVLFLTSFVFGYQTMYKKINNDDITKLNHHKENELESELQIIKDDNIITPNTIIEERIHYLLCNHVITKNRSPENEIVNMSRQEYLEYLEVVNPNIKLISFSPRKITLGLTKNHLCENHYIISEENGFIAVFRIGENGERLLQSVFSDYPISLLMEIDQEKIIKGIQVDSEEELMEILENFIS